MDKSPPKQNLLDLSRTELESFFADLGEKPFRATQVLKWLYQFGVSDFDAMTNLSKALRGQLKEIAEIRTPRVVASQRSGDGTHKWVLELDSGNHIETV
ncbi:MAG: bifunctional tRNA (adenosine(37)-C2)-methyltransferase TrmG/ribosomal RNA large subunit methyltransferase RlmN, partial [Gammaproteobacteria bacterium]